MEKIIDLFKQQLSDILIAPLYPLKETVIFPFLYVPLLVPKEHENIFLNSQKLYGSYFITSLQKNPKLKEISKIDDIYTVGTLCRIIKIESTKNALKVIVQGIQRVIIDNISKSDDIFTVDIFKRKPPVFFETNDDKNKALYELLVQDLNYLVDKGFISNNIIVFKDLTNPISTCYLFLSLITEYEISQKFLDSDDPNFIIKETYNLVLKQKNYLNLKSKIIDQTVSSLNKGQKETFLREQKRIIEEELGESGANEAKEYENKLKKIKNYISKENFEELQKSIDKVKKSHFEYAEISLLKNYLDYVFDLPWYQKTDDNLDISRVKEILDKEHYDLVDVKERILEFLSVKKLNPDSKGAIICFVGPPGVGKTSLAKSIASAIGRKCISISLGGVKDEAEVRGHRSTYIGAMPGKIIQGMKQAKVINPVIVLDEIDKLSSDFRGDPTSALLEVLDPEQNNTFKDHYIRLEYDLSKVMFICTANTINTIPSALKDRLEIVTLSGYCEEEKIQIVKKFSISKKMNACGLKDLDISFNRLAIERIIRNYTKEFGVRELERQIDKICRKVAKKKAEGTFRGNVHLTPRNLLKFLGTEDFTDIEDNLNDIGIVTGLAWTPYGGELLKIEAIKYASKHNEIILTGRLGEVMKESAKIALSLVKANNWDNGLKNYNLHLHVPGGAIPKDGPSAGIALVSCIASLLSGKKIPDSVAMTGEITVSGRVLPVGGIKEKTLAALRSSIKKVILPIDNRKDFENIQDIIKGKIEAIYVSKIEDVLKEINLLGDKS